MAVRRQTNPCHLISVPSLRRTLLSSSPATWHHGWVWQQGSIHGALAMWCTEHSVDYEFIAISWPRHCFDPHFINKDPKACVTEWPTRKWQSWNSNASCLFQNPFLYHNYYIPEEALIILSLSFGRWSWGPRKSPVFELGFFMFSSWFFHLGLYFGPDISGPQFIIHKMEPIMPRVELWWRLNMESMLMSTLCKPLFLWSRRGSIDMIILVLEMDKRCLTEMKCLV